MPWDSVRAILWYVISIVVILGAAYWVTRKLAASGLGGGMNRALGAKIEPIAQLNVGKNERLLLAAIGRRYFLLGITAGGISTLAEFTQQEADEWLKNAPQAQNGQGSKITFTDAMNAVLKKKGRGE